MLRRKRLLIGEMHARARAMLTAGTSCLGRMINPVEIEHPDVDELLEGPEYRWFDCPSYEHCLYIACMAGWESWRCSLCPVFDLRPKEGGPSDGGLEPPPLHDLIGEGDLQSVRGPDLIITGSGGNGKSSSGIRSEKSPGTSPRGPGGNVGTDGFGRHGVPHH